MPPPQDLDTALPRPPWGDVFISWLGAFLGLLAISGVNQAMLPELHASLLVGSFGARRSTTLRHPLRSCTLPARMLSVLLVSSIDCIPWQAARVPHGQPYDAEDAMAKRLGALLQRHLEFDLVASC